MTLPAFVAVPAMSGAAVLAQPGGDGGGQGADFGKSSPVGLLLLLLFFIAVVFLVRSMTKHLKRVPASFEEPEQQGAGSDRADTAAPAHSVAESAVAADGKREEHRDS
ncbi:hypothetical protein SacmaDRAFT_4450 [Saccharomonospora marina XMU15]|uniref:Preprotein translocase subunit SecG n=1 Tax=Saccharomonospora marina XMU15 TaxID=882083 RepID=H5X9Z7_9PSEU|nr:hypothetical protein [Saccharomonospora marina]EHR52635.1 hypothetical protein SacmaDRAFT_4450 [Saccharomonospora marina XMU15]